MGAYYLQSISALRRKGLVYKTNITMPSKDRTRRNKRKDINKCYEINKDVTLSERKENIISIIRSFIKYKTNIINNLKF